MKPLKGKILTITMAGGGPSLTAAVLDGPLAEQWLAETMTAITRYIMETAIEGSERRAALEVRILPFVFN
jgi:hypothetical protein